jgi:hypothetical protein
MEKKHKILAANISLGIFIALIWTFNSRNSSFKDFFGALALIGLVAAPIDLVAGLLLALFKQKTWAYGMLWSAAFFAAVMVFAFLSAKIW